MLKKKSNTSPVIVVAAVAVLLIAVGVLIFVMPSSSAKKYEKQLKLAARYLDELDYDKAIAAYKAAIDIDPKSEDAYLGMAEAYVEKGELQAAVDILKEGLKKTGSEAMEERLAELELKLAEEQAKLTTPTPTPEPAGIGEVNWSGGDWTDRDDVMPHMNDEGYMVFGAYEQDGDESNGPEPIEWEILEENGNGIFLVSRYVLDGQPYNTERTDVTWERCTLRSWLNDEFLNKAFTKREQEQIRITEVANPDNPESVAPDGNSTRDRIFLLSMAEVLSKYSYNSWYETEGFCEELIIPPTVYANQQEVHSTVIDEGYYNGTKYGFRDMVGLASQNYSRDCIGREGAWWWLRSPGDSSITACYVAEYGFTGATFFYNGILVDYKYCGLRPALYIEQ